MSKKSPSSIKKLHVALLVSKFNESITGRLEQGAVETFNSLAGRKSSLTIIEAPGAFELCAVASAAALTNTYDAIVCLGCIIKGETSHDHHLASAVASGLTRISIDHGLPVAFGVLTVDSVEQAKERAGGKHGNKGVEAMTAAIEAARACEHAEAGKSYRLGTAAKDETRRKSSPKSGGSR